MANVTIADLPLNGAPPTTSLFEIDNSGTSESVTLASIISGSQTPWLSDIVAAGFDLTGLSNLEFQNTSGAPAVTAVTIHASDDNLILNVPTDSTIIFKFGGIIGPLFDKDFIIFNLNGLPRYTFTTTSFSLLGNNITNVNNITLNEGGKLSVNSDATEAGFFDAGHTADPSSATSGDLYYNTTTNLYKFFNGTDWFDVGGSAGISSINGDTTAAQLIAAGTGLDLLDAGATHTLSINATVVTLTGIQILTNKTLTSPTIGNFQNATHDHSDAAGGGQLLSTAALSDTDDIVYLNTPNTYIAGNKQSFVSDATAAGINLNAFLPSVPVAGDIFRSAEVMHFIGTSITDYILVSNGQPTTYTAGARQDFLGLLAGTAGLNVGGIAGNPTTQVNGDIWLNTSTNQIFGRINGVDVDLGQAGGTGDVVGPTAATLNAIAIFDNTDGKSIDEGGSAATAPTIDIAGQMFLPRSLQFASFGTVPAGSEEYIQNVINELYFNGNVGLRFFVNNTQIISWSSTIMGFAEGYKLQTNSSTTEAGYRDTGNTGDPSSASAGDFYFNTTTNLYRSFNGTTWDELSSGDVVGPGAATDNAIARFDGASGTLIQNSGITIDDINNVVNIKSVQFTGDATLPAGTTSFIQERSVGGLVINADSAFILFEIGGFGIASISSTDFDLNNLNIQLNTGFLQFQNRAIPTTPGSTLGLFYAKEVTGVAHPFWIDENGLETDLLISNQTPWVDLVDAARFNLDNTGAIIFSLLGPTTEPAVSDPYIKYDITIPNPEKLIINVPSGEAFVFSIAGNENIIFRSTGIDMLGSNIDNVAVVTIEADSSPLLQFSTNFPTVSGSAGDIAFIGDGEDYGNIETTTTNVTLGDETATMTFSVASNSFIAPMITLIGNEAGAASSTISFNGRAMATTIIMGGNSIEDLLQIQDASQNEQLAFASVVFAANHLQITNAAALNGPILEAVGTDTNIAFNINAKGTGAIIHNSNTNLSGNNLTNVGMLQLQNATTLTIAAGVITVTQSYHQVDTEAGAGNDDLDTIDGGVQGDILILRTVAVARDVNVTENGNIVVDGNMNSLTNPNDTIILIFDGTTWLSLSFSNNS